VLLSSLPTAIGGAFAELDVTGALGNIEIFEKYTHTSKLPSNRKDEKAYINGQRLVQKLFVADQMEIQVSG
jgi:hypothetical protein